MKKTKKKSKVIIKRERNKMLKKLLDIRIAIEAGCYDKALELLEQLIKNFRKGW